MQTVVYLIRHSKRMWSWTHDNILKEDDPNSPLSTEGTLLAIKLADREEFTEVDCVYSSPFIRTIETIKHIVEKYNIKVVLDENLRERRVGNRVVESKIFYTSEGEDMNYKCEGGESLNETQERMIKAVNTYIFNHEGQKLIVSSHGTAISTVLKYYDLNYRFEDRAYMKMPDMWKMVFEKGKFVSLEHIDLE